MMRIKNKILCLIISFLVFNPVNVFANDVNSLKIDTDEIDNKHEEFMKSNTVDSLKESFKENKNNETWIEDNLGKFKDQKFNKKLEINLDELEKPRLNVPVLPKMKEQKLDVPDLTPKLNVNDSYEDLKSGFAKSGWGEEYKLNVPEMKGYTKDVMSAFDESFPGLRASNTLPDPKIPDNFKPSEFLEHGNSQREKVFGSVRNSSAYQNIRKNINVGSVMSAATKDMPMPSLESIGSLSSRMSGLNSLNSSKANELKGAYFGAVQSKMASNMANAKSLSQSANMNNMAAFGSIAGGFNKDFNDDNAKFSKRFGNKAMQNSIRFEDEKFNKKLDIKFGYDKEDIEAVNNSNMPNFLKKAINNAYNTSLTGSGYNINSNTLKKAIKAR